MFTVRDKMLYFNDEPIPNPALIIDRKLDQVIDAGELNSLKTQYAPLAMSLSVMDPDGETNLCITEFNNFSVPVEAIAEFLNSIRPDETGIISRIADFVIAHANV